MGSTITKDIGFCQQLLTDLSLVAIPTETVYGLAANAFNEEAVKNIFLLKGRPLFNPLIVHIHNMEQVQELSSYVPLKARQLAEAFWPGSLTLVLPKNNVVPDIISAGKPTVGIRMPKHELTLELLRGLPFPLAAPSANPFTKVSPTSAQHVAHYFGDRIPAILDGGPCQVGLESTIVGFDGDDPIIYRKGGISIEAIEHIVGKVAVLLENETAPQAPGMLLKHYSPNTPLIISDTVQQTINQNSTKRIGVLSFYADDFRAVAVTKVLSPTRDLATAAQGLFAALHVLDALELDLIIAERFPEQGLGSSINDRLRRAQN